MPEQGKQPGFVVAVLALLGLFSIPQVLKLQDGGSARPTAEQEVAGSRSGEVDEEAGDRRDLKPLLELLSNGQPRPKNAPELVSYLSTELRDTKVHCLVITLPDPIESVASSRFDEYLDVLQRAVELQGYVLDRSLLPWKKGSDDPGAPADRVTKFRRGEQDLDLTIETTSPPKPKDSRPGLMVFRSAFPKEGEEASILLAFLVRESPISGVHKRELVRSLDLLDTYFRAKLPAEASSRRVVTPSLIDIHFRGMLPPEADACRSVVHVIAPCFTSSYRSLAAALDAWKPDDPIGYHFRVISSSAAEIDQKISDRIFVAPSPHRLTLHSMVHSGKVLKDAILDYLKFDQGYKPRNIAVLIESNTGLAQALVQHDRQAGANPEDLPVEFLFPLQVSEVRKAYEKAGLLRNGKVDEQAAPERLKIPPDEGGAPRDLARSFTPATSAAHDEMALTQVLSTIARRPYRAVGIIATDPFDVVFLAREVRRFCPNVRLFTIASDLLLARPAEVIDLRGMLVASTYPLYPSNQWMTTPFRNAPRVFFSDRGAQGLFNATAAHLWEMTAEQQPTGAEPLPVPQLLEFGLPYNLTPNTRRQPPVWISAVGERGLYPVQFVPVKTCDLRLLPPARDVRGIPSAGKSLIIVALVDQVLHFRIFDHDGKMVVNTAEKDLPEQAQKIERLRKKLEPLWPPHELAESEKHYVISALTSIVGHTGVHRPSDELYDPSASPERRALSPWPQRDEIQTASVAMRPHPHILFWLLYLSLVSACVIVAGLTWLYIRWDFDVCKYDRESKVLGFLGLGHTLRWLNCDVAEEDAKGDYVDPQFKEPLAGKPFRPQSRYEDRKKNPSPPPIGAGAYVFFINLLVCVLSCYIFWHQISAASPLIAIDLQLISSGVSDIPEKGENLTVVAAVNQVLRFRIFDGAGVRVVDTDEKKLSSHAQQIEVLKSQLESMWPPHELTENEKERVMSAVISIVGYDPSIASAPSLLSRDNSIWSRFHLIAMILLVIASFVFSLLYEGVRLYLAKARERPDGNSGLTGRNETDQRTLYSATGWDLKYVTRQQDIPASGRRLVVVALENGTLHVRIFDGTRKKIYDEKVKEPESSRNAQLRKLLEPLNAPCPCTKNEKTQVISNVLAHAGINQSDLAPRFSVVDSCKRGSFVAVCAILVLFVISIGWLPHASASIVVLSTLASLGRWRFMGRKDKRAWNWIGIASVVGVSFIVAAIWYFASPYILPGTDIPARRLTYDRLTNLPSGVSPIFPVLFLALAFGAGIYSSLARRRLYRLSYLPSDVKAEEDAIEANQFKRILFEMRKTRGKVDQLIALWHANPCHGSPFIVCFLILLGFHIALRIRYRGLPSSLEGPGFDLFFWCGFLIAFLLIIWRILKLMALWRSIRRMLHLAVDLPLTPAYDRIPTRFKGWFFGGEDFKVREQIILQQTAALRERTSEKLAQIFSKLEVVSAPFNLPAGETWSAKLHDLQTSLGKPTPVHPEFRPATTNAVTTTQEAPPATPGAEPAPPKGTTVAPIAATATPQAAPATRDGNPAPPEGILTTPGAALEKPEGTLDSTRAAYDFLTPIWALLPVEDLPRLSSDQKKETAAEWLASWPLTPELSARIARDERRILRDWVRMAEDLIALQIVRWFAPAISQFMPLMQYLVIAPISLLLAVTSYPFDHQGWLLTMMVGLILFVAVVIGNVMLGVNRDELISRVSNTTPGRLTFDSHFVGAIFTMFAPLIGALLAISFDMSDLLHTWFGPMFQLF